jgi:hypothetical protein
MDVMSGLVTRNRETMMYTTCLRIRGQVTDMHDWNTKRFQSGLLFGHESVPGDDGALGVELVQLPLVGLRRYLGRGSA